MGYYNNSQFLNINTNIYYINKAEFTEYNRTQQRKLLGTTIQENTLENLDECLKGDENIQNHN